MKMANYFDISRYLLYLHGVDISENSDQMKINSTSRKIESKLMKTM